MSKPKVLFVYDIPDERYWRDGLFMAVKELEEDLDIVWLNLHLSANASKKHAMYVGEFNFVLGWGGFNSPVDQFCQEKRRVDPVKIGLCLGGYGFTPSEEFRYDIIFYETDWSRRWILQHSSYRPEVLVHAFGINSNIFNISDPATKIWDYTTIGAFSEWKRQRKLLEKPGYRLAVGQIQLDNIKESMSIIGDLLLGGVCVSDQVLPEKLADIYRASQTVYLPADLIGGSERSVLEARACGVSVEVEYDNSKLQELLDSPIWTEKYYAEQLKKGILSCLR